MTGAELEMFVIKEGGAEDWLTITDGRRAIAYVEPGPDCERIARLMALAPRLMGVLRVLTAHAQETYPHFESERGQRDIAEARAILDAAEGARQ